MKKLMLFMYTSIFSIPALSAQNLPNDGNDVSIPNAAAQIVESYVDYTESECFFRYQPSVSQEALADANNGNGSKQLRYSGKCNSTPTWEDRGDKFVVVEEGYEMKVREYWRVEQAITLHTKYILAAVSNKAYIKCCPLKKRWTNS